MCEEKTCVSKRVLIKGTCLLASIVVFDGIVVYISNKIISAGYFSLNTQQQIPAYSTHVTKYLITPELWVAW